MSKQMTPCEKLGYKVGDEFTVIEDSFKFGVGSIVSLQEDDGTSSPYFTNECVKDEYPYGVSCFLSSVKKFSKLKPAKQALADAIHQNGGWRELANYAVQSDCDLRILFTDEKNKPSRCVGGGWRCKDGFMFFGATSPLKSKLPNWHQCILSRDEYFTAYPEQVKVEVNNETERKLEVEMKSGSEMTIKVGDWHKNGELPPVGAFVDVVGNDLVYGVGESNCEVIAHVENTAVIRMSYGLGCFEFGAITPARTERDKAIDEMVDCLSSRWANCDEIAAHLYENGYRKEVK